MLNNINVIYSSSSWRVFPTLRKRSPLQELCYPSNPNPRLPNVFRTRISVRLLQPAPLYSLRLRFQLLSNSHSSLYVSYDPRYATRGHSAYPRLRRKPGSVHHAPNLRRPRSSSSVPTYELLTSTKRFSCRQTPLKTAFSSISPITAFKINFNGVCNS